MIGNAVDGVVLVNGEREIDSRLQSIHLRDFTKFFKALCRQVAKNQ